VLAERGPLLERPLVDTVNGSRHSNMKELWPGSAGRTELRVLFAFDPQRTAIVLVAGDKQGQWQRWYDDSVPIADERFDAHLQTLPKATKQQKGRRKTMMTLDDWLAKRPVDRKAVERHKARMRAELRAHALRELREAQGLTQTQVAGLLHVSQNRVSALERGEVEHIQIDTLRRYVDALGGQLRIEAQLGDDRIQIA
jgi:predicted XRE-type DNA-binding protein